MPPIDWAARLDARGYHITSVSRHDTAARFDGPVRVADDGWVEGDAVIAFDPEQPDVQLRIQVGDPVYMSGSRRGQPAEIARIDSFFAKAEDGDIWFYNTFFWRPERMRLGDDEPWEPAELFLQTTPDESENSVAAIELTRVHITQTADVASVTAAAASRKARETAASNGICPALSRATSLREGCSVGGVYETGVPKSLGASDS